MDGAAVDDRRLSLSKLWVLMVTAFVDMIGFALIVPLLPFYATRFGADGLLVGVLVGAFAFGQMITAPWWGRMSDHFGRKPVLIFAQALSAGAFLIFAVADSVWVLLLCRLLQGVGGGSLGTVSAYVSDAVAPAERAKALGWITACTSAGVMVGPAIGSLTVSWHSSAPGLIAAGFCVVNMLFTWRWLSEAKAPSKARRRKPLAGQVKAVIMRPAVTVHSLIWIYSAGMMAFMAMTGIMALYLAARFGVTVENIGWFYVAVGFVSVLMRAIVLGAMVQRFGEVITLRLGAVCLGVGMIGMTLATSPVRFALWMLFIPAGTALLFPCTTSLITRYADPDAVGQTVGVQQAFGGSSRLLAPMWAGAVFEHVGQREPFWIGGALVLLTALLSLRLKPGESPARSEPAATDALTAESQTVETELAAPTFDPLPASAEPAASNSTITSAKNRPHTVDGPSKHD